MPCQGHFKAYYSRTSGIEQMDCAGEDQRRMTITMTFFELFFQN